MKKKKTQQRKGETPSPLLLYPRGGGRIGRFLYRTRILVNFSEILVRFYKQEEPRERSCIARIKDSESAEKKKGERRRKSIKKKFRRTHEELEEEKQGRTKKSSLIPLEGRQIK